MDEAIGIGQIWLGRHYTAITKPESGQWVGATGLKFLAGQRHPIPGRGNNASTRFEREGSAPAKCDRGSDALTELLVATCLFFGVVLSKGTSRLRESESPIYN